MLKLLFLSVVVLLVFAALALVYRMIRKEYNRFLGSPLSVALALLVLGLILICVGLLFADAGQGDYPHLFVLIAGAGVVLSVSTGAHIVILTFRYLMRNKQE
ncbi:hypothetical protein FT643_06985 [Ketobacter sp. MCCC 1A13808]|uniref:hypothetical protein n=1 Tax=Ketobacter sp. MCCC 1A13808 TaxID=2602738 RepID=UPI000F2A357E|nr:hypothetical protein [Ketobacter sp. MCCC 1A13808]MVF11889.1 hypothetical protein [Ketobacter sp. MCCC 1A13808]RLP53070.1 MAG: hypothetical protein D6160_17650 [Ketobacter sp.]